MHFITPEDAFFEEKSTLDILKLVHWKKQNNLYNFKVLPKTAILSQTNILSKKDRVLLKRVKGITGKNYILSGSVLICTGFGNGAPAIVSLMEELRALGVTAFLFMGFAGRIQDTIKEGEICIVNKAYSTVGCTMFYSAEDSFIPNKNNWFANLNTKLNWKNAICWSTDAPFRETPSLITTYTKKGADLVDMECAAIYAFSQFYGLNALCVLVASDSLFNMNWLPPKNMDKLNKTMINTFKTLYKLISNV
ncbi:hypothetical protein HNV10_13780 [Winogradskyella litoriviva]|uniref:Uridine phosphorylase n=1 Tax=Winogradskyella litoriviva TaxID=1220182 RepID=A0ABX2E7Q0_9FLAO|nr:hypothetical protein [Winogradskyella litoriviva]NRD24324.1 hypothetical protein [Winogradskyella litoriviva]